MTTWRWTAPLADAVRDALADEPWDEEYKAELQETLDSVPEDAVVCDERGLRHADGSTTPWDDVPEEDPVDDHPPHPVTLVEYFGLQHLAELEDA